MSGDYLFTSESVSEGHPDKVADQISDAVLDAILARDPDARVACETLVKTGVAVVAGEVTTRAWVDLEALVRGVICDIGYTSSDVGFDGRTCGIVNIIGKQSPDIAQGVDRGKPENQGAGDQGLMFGYASDETPALMPAPIHYAHKLVERQAKVRKGRQSKLPWLRPDAKSQLTFAYRDHRPVGIEAVVLSTQHAPDVSQKVLREAVMEEIIKPVLPARWLSRRTRYHINPTGRFVTGGPVGDCGLTGRKIIVDSYGGMARHGGGAFSGQGPLQGGPLRGLRGAICREEPRCGRPCAPLRDPAVLRDRRGEADLGLGEFLRNRAHSGRASRKARRGPLRPAALWHHPHARPDPPDVPRNRVLRAFRARTDRDGIRLAGRCPWRRPPPGPFHGFQLGTDRPGGGAEEGCGNLTEGTVTFAGRPKATVPATLEERCNGQSPPGSRDAKGNGALARKGEK